MSRLLSPSLVSATLLLLCASARGQMQCEGGLVTVGESQEQVLEKCGPPTNRVRDDLTRVEPVQTADGDVVNEAVDVPRAEWIYNFGPDQFVKTIVFVNGEVTVIKDGDYGE